MKLRESLAIAALLQALFSTVAGPQSLQKIRIGYPSISSRQGQLWIAKDEGIFRKYLKRTPKKPYPTMEGIQNLVAMSASQTSQAKSAKPEQFVDLSLLQELETEKFLDDMAQRYR
jgi:hypothetical protein